MHRNVCTMYIGQMCDNNIIQMTMFTHIHCCALVKTTDDWRRFSSTIWPFFYYNQWSSWFCCTFCHAVTWSQILTEYTGLWSIPCFRLSFAFSFQTKLFVSFGHRCIRLKEILSFISSNYTLHWCGKNTTLSMIAWQIYWNLKIFLLNGDTFKWISLSNSCSLWLKKNFEHVWHCSLWNTILSLKLKSSF